MQAIFIASIQFMRKEYYLSAAFTYATLLNFKHIYLYAALAFVVALLKLYVLAPSNTSEKITRLIKLGIVTLLPFLLAFLPFILTGGITQIQQILSRLFPFQRGLIHDYWAPNFWALYHFLDNILSIINSSSMSQYLIFLIYR